MLPIIAVGASCLALGGSVYIGFKLLKTKKDVQQELQRLDKIVENIEVDLAKTLKDFRKAVQNFRRNL